jgi:hypothetical protein
MFPLLVVTRLKCAKQISKTTAVKKRPVLMHAGTGTARPWFEAAQQPIIVISGCRCCHPDKKMQTSSSAQRGMAGSESYTGASALSGSFPGSAEPISRKIGSIHPPS